jgi:hypothetical protein
MTTISFTRFVEAPSKRIDHWRADAVAPDGSLLDPWGTPYKIDFSGKQPLIRSAGPNKQFEDSGRKRSDDYTR